MENMFNYESRQTNTDLGRHPLNNNNLPVKKCSEFFGILAKFDRFSNQI